jgi:hypothetical protein
MNLIKEIERLSKKVDKISSDIEQERLNPTHWRGRKIVPVEEWNSISLFRREEAFNYLPDDFVAGPFTAIFSDEDVEALQKIPNWMQDYIAFLEYTKNPSYGRDKCGRCILNGAAHNYDSMGIKDIIRRELQLEVERNSHCTGNSSSVSNGENDNQKGSSALNPFPFSPSLEYPCPIGNRFECPYSKNSNNKKDRSSITDSAVLPIDDDYLIAVGEIVDIVCDAIRHAHSLTYKNDTTYYANFDADRVHSVSRYGGLKVGPGPLEKGLNDLIISKVPVRTIEDIYHVLTDEQTLKIVLDQYPKANALGESKELIIKFFVDIRNIFTVEELRDPYGRSIEESAKVQRYLENTSQLSILNHYNSICHVCKGRWANIQCLNCNVWICVDHWKQHRSDYHLQ